MSRTSALVSIVHLASVVTLAAQTPPPDAWPIRDAPPALHEVISRADTIIVTMHDALLRELREGLARGGPVAAIASCHVDAAGVSQRLARGEGIAAGRTSDRLRNPSNAPRPWAAALVKANAGRRMRDVDGFAVDLGDRVGVLRPIAQARTCLSCHGPVERITPAMRQLLAEKYPADRAVGFEEGQVRGWYWVEMPKPR
jgi:uncharacterized protein DUF3365